MYYGAEIHSSTLKMEEVVSSEMLVTSYQATEGVNIQLTLQESKVALRESKD